MESKQVVVVGSKGFIGRNVVKRIADIGHEVIGVASDSRNKLIDSAFWQEIQPTHIIWLASRITPYIAQSNPETVRQELDEFSLFLEAVEGIPAQVVFASSGGTVYTDESLPFSESSVAFGANEYGRSKIAMELALVSSEIDSTILRIANAYGFGQRFDRGQGVISVWINQILSGQPISVFGSLKNVRDFVYIDDVVSAIIASIQTSDSQGVFNIGSGDGIELNNIIEELKVISGQDFNVSEFASRSVDRKAIWLDIAKAEKVLNWTPKISLHQGLEKTWTMAKNNMQ